MKGGGQVSEDLIGQAKVQMRTLMNGLRAISAVALTKAVVTSVRGAAVPDETMTEAAKRHGNEESGPVTRRRIDAKAEVPAEFAPPDILFCSDAETALMQAYPPSRNTQHDN